MKEYFEERIELLKNNESFVLASIYESQGSAPRAFGAKMIVKKDGSIIGTVGGGKIEALVIEEAKEIFDTKLTRLKAYKLLETENQGIGMSCGGDVRVVMEYVDGENTIDVQIYEKSLKAVEEGKEAFIIRKYDADGKNKNYYYDKNNIFPDIEIENIKEYVKHIKNRYIFIVEEKNSIIVVEPIFSTPRLFLFGAGHISQSLAKLAKGIDFITTVVDDRADYANYERFPLADEIINPKSFEKCFKNISINSNSYIVILTRGHLFDLTVLKQALKTEAFYIGMIGSKRKREAIFSALKPEGFTRGDFNMVHNPIGLEIGAETPEEIAISIAAELIKVRKEQKL